VGGRKDMITLGIIWLAIAFTPFIYAVLVPLSLTHLLFTILWAIIAVILPCVLVRIGNSLKIL
jgi:glucan phosphoethanolaminetransferase (alkaline phosphatase superfamily)